MNADSARYARITHRLSLGAASEGDDASQALAAVLERRIVESIAVECAPKVTSDLLSERVAQAVAALRECSVALRIDDDTVTIERCFCESDVCGHPAALLGRLLGVEIESMITNEGLRALRVLGVMEPPGYTMRASMNASRLRS